MNPLAAWWSASTAGFGTPSPLEFASLVLPRSPNACLALPEGHPGQAHLRTPSLAAAPDAVFAALLALAAAEPRTTRLASWPERRQAQWVVRSARLRFPDLVVAEAQPAGDGTALFLCSRSLIGWSDLGVNRARLTRWLSALPGALSREAPAASPHGPPLGPPPSRLARALAARAAGRQVLIAGPPAEAPALLLEALAAGARGARVLHAPRSDGADARLRAAGERLGLADLARAVLDAGAVGEPAAAPSRFARTEAPPAWWLAEPLDTPDLQARLGPVDLIADGTGLHLRPEPLRHLARLRRIGARWLLLTSAVVPEGLLAAPAAAGALDAGAMARLDAGLRAAGIALPQLTALAGGLTAEGARAAGLSDPWWWFLPEAGMAGLLADAGWTLRAARREGDEVLVEAEAA